MNLSNRQRVGKLLLNLLKHPSLIVPYLGSNLIRRSNPIEQRTAWWSFLAIQDVDKRIKGKRVFEYGMGGSTLRWARLVDSWTAVEHDPKWLKLVQGKLSEDLKATVECRLSSYRFREEDGSFATSDHLLALNEPYDVVLIDGMERSGKDRCLCFKRAEQFIRKNGFIVVDDFWRYDKLLQQNHARSVKVFESVGPCRFGVTSTAVFYY